ncbi:MAG: hypothetical protein ACSHW7_07845 [Patiriisocius sp.]|uniref:hypothetical protein n=1 Tax=Patiriisocius sp. TaxID=2822396 RepID=UPI003EF5B085
MSIKKNLFTTMFLVFTFFIISCGANDDDDIVNDPCLRFITPPEITITNPSIEVVNNDTLTGYVLRALITNNTSEIIEGEATIYTTLNGISAGFGSLISCNRIEPNETCEFISSGRRPENELDFGGTIRCTYYKIY